MNIFSENTLTERKTRAAQSLNQTLGSGELVLFYSGEPIQKPGGLDQTYSFLPHPDYYWLSGLRRSSGVVAYSKDTGWVDFVKPLSNEEKVWEGGSEQYPGHDVSGLEKWINNHKFSKIYTLGQAEKKVDQSVLEKVQESFNKARRHKDAAEVQLIRDMAKAAAKGYEKITQFIKPGVSEREIQIEYETAVLKAGSEKFPYDTIVGTGTNSAILHAIPTDRIVKDGEIVLVDAGADKHDYCVDITRVYPANGKFTSQQKALYDIVLKAQIEGISMCKPGVQWHDVHTQVARLMAQGLKDLNILKGDIDSALETAAIAVFFPHGVGHMVGHRVRDVGGIVGLPTKSYCGARLRVDLPLEENFVMTVEPGLYFIPALIDQAPIREKHKDLINWSEVEKWRNFGGIRIEDDILVTAKGPENLTAMVAK